MPAHDPRYSKADLDAVDFPELSDEELKRLRPASEVMPRELFRKLKARGPQKAPTKVSTSIRLDRDLLDKLKARGPGWQSEANAMLRKAVGLK